jgi:hypothetical protein
MSATAHESASSKLFWSHSSTSSDSLVDLLVSFSGGTSDALLDVQWRQKRQLNRAQASTLRTDHRKSFADSIEAHVRDLLKRPLTTVLQELAETWGVAWADVARMVGVSVPALRKWRTRGGAAGDNMRRLAELTAFLRLLKEVGVEEPASWISIPSVGGYTVTPRHLYKPGMAAAALVDLASGSIAPEEVLSELHPSWKTDYATDFEVVVAEDGMPAIVTKKPVNG